MAVSLLPVASSEKASTAQRLTLHPGVYVAAWMFFSNLTILFNKWLIDNAGFKYPVILTCWHMVFATSATQILAKTTTILDSRRSIKMTGHFYLRAVVPIGILYSGSLVCSNLVYLYLNVAFIQMLKSVSPFATLTVAWLWGQENPTGPVIFKVLVIVLGVLVASAGEIHFSWTGCLYQLCGLVFEALRIVMIKALMSDQGMNIDPLVSLYYFAPVCAVTNFFVALFTDFLTFQWVDIVRVGVWTLFLNAFTAFLLNVASVLLIGKTSGLVLNLTGILKNILLVVAAVLIWNTLITPFQVFGYGVSLIGFVLYRSSLKDLKEAFVKFSAKCRKFAARGPDDTEMMSNKWIVFILVVLPLTVMVAFLFAFSHDPSTAVVLHSVHGEHGGWLSWMGF